MGYLNTTARTTSPTSNESFKPLGRLQVLNGVYLGWVKDAKDIQRMGRLQVWVPEFGSAPDDKSGWISVSYCSPFAGATNVETASKTDFTSFENTQTSYGMWMVPPDVNSQVVIMFINGDLARGIWIGSMYNQFMNSMVPGVASDTLNYTHPGKKVPVADYNKWNTRVTHPDSATRPVNNTKFKGIGNQGLINDPIRGVRNSSARREAPSNIYGISTPGPAIDNKQLPENIRRKGGSSLIMDDSESSEAVQLVTKSGAQITLNETTGDVYIINRDGTAWVQMNTIGDIDIFGARNISMRAQRDFNIRADRNINIEAGQNIFIKAAKDTRETKTTFTYSVNNTPKMLSIPEWKYVGEGKGDGGNIVVQSLNNMHSTVKGSAYLTIIDNNYNIKSGNNINIESKGIQNFKANQGIKLASDGSIDVVARGSIRVNTAGKLSVVGEGSIVVCTSGQLDLKAAGKANLLSADAVNLVGASVNSPTMIKTPVIYAALAAPGAVPTPNPDSADAASTASGAQKAEIKPLNPKINILATWKDPKDKFIRNSEEMKTTVTTLPTYEPCPEHSTFSFKYISGYKPTLSEADRTYEGSGSGVYEGSTPKTPSANTTPGANNTEIKSESDTNIATKDFNMSAYRCQLELHEGVKYISYLDSVNLPTGGIGHLLRENEINIYPVPTPISEEKVAEWFTQDAESSIKGAQVLLGIDVWVDLSDVRKRACADLCYNLGKNRLSKFVNFLSFMKSKDYDKAGASLVDSKWYRQVKRRGVNIVNMITKNIDSTGCAVKFPENI